MKSFKTIFSFSIAALTCAALIACNKSGGNEPQLPPPPVVPQVQVYPPQPLIPSGPMYNPRTAASRPVAKPGRLMAVKCEPSYGTQVHRPEYFAFDGTKVINQEVPFFHSNQLGKVTVNVQPDTFDANGAMTSLGFFEISLTEVSGSPVSTLRGDFYSFLSLDIYYDNQSVFSMNCYVVKGEGGQWHAQYNPVNSKDAYTCSTNLPQVQTGTTPSTPIANSTSKVLKKNAQPQILIDNPGQVLKFKKQNRATLETAVLVDERKTQNRTISWSAVYGQPFMLTTGGGTAASTSVLCQPAPNAAQQK